MDLISTSDWIVFVLVVGARFLLPLLIPFYPLPAIIACLLLDGVDQTIFQVFTRLPLDGYQSYDKALDIHYLTIAYISTFRNWTNNFAFSVSRFLFYYRLIGVALFEALHLRAVLLIFPNTFEYFFIWYETVKLWWDPRKLTRVGIISVAAAIWIIIKLPQEYWLHIAQRDMTDTVKILLGGQLEDPWLPLIMANLLPIVAVLIVLALLVIGAYYFARRNTRKPDYKLGWRAGDNTTLPTEAQFARARATLYERIFDRDLLEKIVLVGLLVYIFANMMPTVSMTAGRLALYVVILVTATTAISHLLARRGTTIASGVAHFAAVFAVNMVLSWLIALMAGRSYNWMNATLFMLIMGAIVTLFDRFQPFHEARFPRGEASNVSPAG